MGRRAGAAAARAAAMAQCVQSVQELIPDSFVPCVAALCSDEAERLTRLNHLSFAELLKPFSRLTSEGMWSPPFFAVLRESRAGRRKLGAGREEEGDVYTLEPVEWRPGLGPRGVPRGGWGRGHEGGCQDGAVLTSSLPRLFPADPDEPGCWVISVKKNMTPEKRVETVSAATGRELGS